MWISSAKSNLGLLDSIVRIRSVEWLSEGKLCCLRHRIKVSTVCLLYKIYLRVNSPINKYLKHFVTARNIKASAALGVLTFVIERKKLINSVGRFCLLLFVYRTCCRRTCLVVAP